MYANGICVYDRQEHDEFKCASFNLVMHSQFTEPHNVDWTIDGRTDNDDARRCAYVTLGLDLHVSELINQWEHHHNRPNWPPIRSSSSSSLSCYCMYPSRPQMGVLSQRKWYHHWRMSAWLAAARVMCNSHILCAICNMFGVYARMFALLSGYIFMNDRRECLEQLTVLAKATNICCRQFRIIEYKIHFVQKICETSNSAMYTHKNERDCRLVVVGELTKHDLWSRSQCIDLLLGANRIYSICVPTISAQHTSASQIDHMKIYIFIH